MGVKLLRRGGQARHPRNPAQYGVHGLRVKSLVLKDTSFFLKNILGPSLPLNILHNPTRGIFPWVPESIALLL